jgi:hypothetical protein
MLFATVAHRFLPTAEFPDGDVRTASVHAADLSQVLAAVDELLGEWDTGQDDTTTIRIMTAEVNGHA